MKTLLAFLLVASVAFGQPPGPPAPAAAQIETAHRAIYEELLRRQSEGGIELTVVDKGDLKMPGASAEVAAAKGKGVYVRGPAEFFRSEAPFTGVALLMSSGDLQFDGPESVEAWRKGIGPGETKLVKAYLYDAGDKGRVRPRWTLHEIGVTRDDPLVKAEKLVKREAHPIEKWERIDPAERYAVHLYIFRQGTNGPRLILRTILPSDKPVVSERIELVVGQKTFTFPAAKVGTEVLKVGPLTTYLETSAVDVTDSPDFVEALVRAKLAETRTLRVVGARGEPAEAKGAAFSDRSYPYLEAIILTYYAERFAKKGG